MKAVAASEPKLPTRLRFGESGWASGRGRFTQAGYYFPEFRPQSWALYEEWDSDAAGGLGSYNSGRVGLTYFARGQFERTRI